MQLFSPAIKAFERLQAADGLLITADHWQRTQTYHRQRQNFYYQSLYQAGIVNGLGVSVVAAPEGIEARYRNERWIQVQPGIAIDVQGNPIVVTEPCVFQVQSQCTDGEPKTIYMVLNYVDPDELRHPPGRDWVRETFRILEKTTLDTLDVELCRIQLVPPEMALTVAADVFSPGANTLDLNHRRPIRNRPDGVVIMARLIDPATSNPAMSRGLTHLSKAVDVLYPALAGGGECFDVPLDGLATGWLLDYDLLYVSYDLLPRLPETLTPALSQHVHTGGTILIALDEDINQRGELVTIRRELVAALKDADLDPSVAAATESLQAEIAAIDTELSQFTQQACQSVAAAMERLGLPLSGAGDISSEAPLRTQPFLFSRWPDVGVQPVELFCWGGIILMIGNLAAVWGPDDTGTRSRETIRTAHELGINLLHYGWRRRQLMQLQSGHHPEAPLSSPDSLTRQVTT